MSTSPEKKSGSTIIIAQSSASDVALRARAQADMAAAKLQKQGIHPLLASLFAARGVTDSSEVRGKLADTLPGSTLKNCHEMASLLADCVASQKRVLVVSDYDCDGATACAILVSAFRSCGMNAGYLVPDRRKHGYGLTESIVDEAALLDPKPDFIITVDNGISSFAGVERARHHGIEVLVTDHHLSPKTLPNARLIVNPNQPDCTFESKHIAGCGVAWYVARALAEELKARKKVPGYDPASLLQFVALGTVADVVILDRNNRILIAEGLKRIRKGECTEGFKALAEISKKQFELMSCVDFGFAIAPRINAAGRLEHMACGIEALLTEDRALGTKLANMLDCINIERKEITKRMAGEAELIVDALEKKSTKTAQGPMSIVVYGEDWNEGVIGIVAGRIKEIRNRPTLVLCKASDGSIKGSGRSIPGLHMKHALDKIDVNHPGILQKFGGHGMAAGVTIAPDRIGEFTSLFEAVCREELKPEHLQRVITHDGELLEEDMNIATIKALSREVWGQGFEQPMFIDTFKVVGAKTMGDAKQHIKLNVQKGDLIVDAVAWDAGHLATNLPDTITAVFQPQINSYRGNESIQIMVSHLPEPGHALTLQVPVKPQPKTIVEEPKIDITLLSAASVTVAPPAIRRGGFRRL